MRTRDRFRFVLQNMKKNKMRVSMTVLATAMGCAFLIVLASVGFGLQRSVVEEITGGRLLTEITIYAKQSEEGGQPLTIADIEYLNSVKHVKTVTRRQMFPAGVFLGQDDKQVQTQAIGFDAASEKKAGLELSEGRLPSKDNEIVIGYDLGQTLAGDQAAKTLINKELPLRIEAGEGTEGAEGELTEDAISATIVGITKKLSREWQKDHYLYMDFGLFTKLKADFLDGVAEGDKQLETYEVSVFADHVKYVVGIADTIRAEGYMNHSVANELDKVNVLFLIMKLGLILVGTIALLIASIGIYNTMTMAVTERSQDIGIMKAIGMHPKTVKSIFLIESSYIGLLGAIIGTIVSYGISGAVNVGLPIIIERFLKANPPEGLMFSYIPLGLTLLCVGISIAVAIMSGMRPAVRATQIDVLKALRRDL